MLLYYIRPICVTCHPCGGTVRATASGAARRVRCHSGNNWLPCGATGAGDALWLHGPLHDTETSSSEAAIWRLVRCFGAFGVSARFILLFQYSWYLFVLINICYGAILLAMFFNVPSLRLYFGRFNSCRKDCLCAVFFSRCLCTT